MKKAGLLIWIQLLLLRLTVISQLSTNSNVSPTTLVQNVLLGGGVVASNISYSGNSNAIGSFNGSSCNIGLGAGVIITTGTVKNQTSLLGKQQGPFGPNNLPDAGYDNLHGGNSLLESIVNADTYNAAVLEFDFTATGTEVSFRYVFGSEEYPEYVNQGYNDVFGFFISGPNPLGGNYNNTNIARVPGSNSVVSIDNVNSSTNSAYYVNNGDGNTSPQNSSAYYVQYDGFTVPLTAHANLVCGATYHIKIAIADVGDPIFDSGVFLEEQSFVSHDAVEVTTQTNNVAANLADNQIYEGCGDVNVILTRSDSLAYSQTFSVSYSGSANSSTDFSSLPGSVTFSPGQTSQSFLVEGIYDSIQEGTESLLIMIQYYDACGNLIQDQVTLYLLDEPPLNLIMPPDTALACPNSSIDIQPVVSGGVAPYSYSWNNGSTSSSIDVSPVSSTTYSLTVRDACSYQMKTGSTFVDVLPYQPPVVDLGSDIAIQCPNQEVLLGASVNNGYGAISYLWENGGTTDTTTVQSLYTNNYWIQVTDACGSQALDTVKVTILGSVLQTETFGGGVYCKSDSIEIGVEATGGTGDYSYLWSNLDTTSIVNVLASDQNYYVEVQDACGTYSVYDTVVVRTESPTAEFETANEDVVVNTNQYFTNLSTDAVSYYWDFGNGVTSTETNPYTTFTEETNFDVMLVAIDENNCVDTTIHTIIVRPHLIYFVPNAFTPNGDGYNDVFKGKGVGVKVSLFQIFDRWGELIFSSTNPNAYWDGTYNGKPAQNDVYIYKIQLTGYDNSYFEKTGHVTLVR